MKFLVDSEVKYAYQNLAGVTGSLSCGCSLTELDKEFLYPLYRMAKSFIKEYDKYCSNHPEI